MRAPLPRRLALLALATLAAPAGAQQRPATAPDPADTRLLAQPAASAQRVAFLYAGDLWTARHDGTDVRRLTSTEGDESSPVFTPDGASVAFSANYDGNVDVYLVAATGGVPQRLTWHPGPDLVQDVSPDGASVLFTSGRESYTGRFTQLWEVPVGGGPERRLAIPNADRAVYSPDGRRIAYNPLGPAYEQWKRYRGGRVSQLWLYDRASHAIEKVPQPAGRSNDVPAAWVGDAVVFRSDRGGEFDLWRYDVRTKALAQLTRSREWPVVNASGRPGAPVAFEQGGWVHLMDPAAGTARRLTLGVPSDLRETRARWIRGADYVRNASISPTGARVAFEVRGEIATVPAEKGDPRVITNTPGAHERSPAWSPDGSRIAYISDASGEYEIHVASAAATGARGEPRAYKPGGHGFYYGLEWSPDGRRIAFADNAQEIRILELASGRVTKVAANHTYEPYPSATLGYDWSPDSRWLAYTVNTRPLVAALHLFDTQSGRSTPVTDGLSEVTQPAFDRGGRYLYAFGSTDAGPVRDWFAQSTTDSRRTRTVYAVVLRRGDASPVARESDEERATAPQTTDTVAGRMTPEPRRATGRRPVADTARADTTRAAGVPGAATRIDLEGIEQRIVALPIPAASLESLGAGDAGQLLYMREADGRSALVRYDLNKRRSETLLPEVTAWGLSRDGKKLFYRQGQGFYLTSAAAPKAGEGRVSIDGVEVRIDPAAEWRQIFDEAWRVNRDWFYAPNMHGVDWNAAKARYAALLPHVATRADLNRVITWMMSELSVGHHRGGGGDRLNAPRTVPGGLLGADYEVADGRWRFKVVYGGLNWTPELRAPLTEPGVGVRAGEYLLAVNGRELRAPANVHAALENTANRITEITVGPRADGTGSRTVQVVPIANEGALRNRAWVERNLRLVDSLSGGRVAYVYVPNTAEPGFSYFKRYFYPQAHKDAIVVDERHNGGGQVADYYIDILRRPLIAHWALRYGADLRTPTAMIQGPKALLADETAGSGGDLLPWMWRKFQMGPVIGQRTWGGLVGILGYPVLMDGGSITAPNLAIYTNEDGWTVENEGVPADMEVEQVPAEVIAGRDPQLLRAVEWVMAELRKSPPQPGRRPPYPDKTNRTSADGN